MKAISIGLFLFLAMTAFLEDSAAQQTAQPLAEQNVAAEFQQAAPRLFQEWKTDYATSADLQIFGTEASSADPSCYSSGAAFFFEFAKCTPNTEPVLVSIDVRRTDSLLSPFIGIIVGTVSETCVVARLVPTKGNWSRKHFDRIKDRCLSRSHEECLAAGALPAPKGMTSKCTGGPETTFSFKSEAIIIFKWSQGKWEFEKQEMKEERRIPATLRVAAGAEGLRPAAHISQSAP